MVGIAFYRGRVSVVSSGPVAVVRESRPTMTGNSSESGSSGRTNNRRFKDKITKQWAIFCGDCGPLRNYIASKSFNSSWAVVKFLDALFRGYGQVVLANNPISGILIFIGLTVADPVVSATGLLTACVGLLVSIWVIPQPKDVVANGLTVFNPLLIGLVTGNLLPTVYGIEIEYWHFFYMIVATVICVYVTAAIGNILNSISRHPLPYLSLPFNVVQQLLFLLLITLGPAKIDVSTTTVEPHLLNNSMSHETFGNIPIVPSSLVSPERLVQSKDSVTVLSSEWSDSRNLDHNKLSQMDAATEEYTKKFKDEVGNNHMIQNNTPAIENFDVDRGTEFMKAVSEDLVKLHVVIASNFVNNVDDASNNSTNQLNIVSGTETKEKGNEDYTTLHAVPSSNILVNIDETNDGYTTNVEAVPVTESMENVSKEVAKLYAFISSRLGSTTDDSVNDSTNHINILHGIESLKTNIEDQVNFPAATPSDTMSIVHETVDKSTTTTPSDLINEISSVQSINENKYKLYLAPLDTMFNVEEINDNESSTHFDIVSVTESIKAINEKISKLHDVKSSYIVTNVSDNNSIHLNLVQGNETLQNESEDSVKAHPVIPSSTLVRVDENLEHSTILNVLHGDQSVQNVTENKVPSNILLNDDEPNGDSTTNSVIFLATESPNNINGKSSKLHAVTSSNVMDNVRGASMHEVFNGTNSSMHDAVEVTNISVHEELNVKSEKTAGTGLQKDLSDDSMAENPTSLKLEDSSNGHHSSLVTNRSENNFLDLDVDDGEKDFREERSVADEELLDLANVSNNSNADEEPPIEVDWGGVFSGIVLSMSQAYACNYAPTSVLIYLAVLIYSPITAGFGVVGATVGTVAGVFLTEADTYSAAGGVYDGSWGFNGVLAGMCLGGLFFVISWSSTAITILGVLFTSILQYVFLPSFTKDDLLIMTLPFNISTLLFLCVTSGNLVRPKAISFPEKQRREYRQLDSSEKNSRDQLSSASADDLDKDSELEKKLAHAEVV